MPTPRKIKDYVNKCLSDSKAASKLMRERKLMERKAYKGRKLRRIKDE